MRPILSERNIVVVLFVMVLVTFSLAHEDSKKMEQLYLRTPSPAVGVQPIVKNQATEQATVIPGSFKD